MDLSLFTESETQTKDDIKEEMPNYYLKYNYENVELSEKYLLDIFQKYGIKTTDINFDLFKKSFTHISYCYDPVAKIFFLF